jgi:mannan endo-1,4-beta-mannosidase
MKWLTVSIFAALAAVDAMPTADKRAVAAFPSVSGTKFTIDGVTKYFAGTNSYWIGFLTNNADVETTMEHISTSGLKILRVWGFNDVNGGGNGVYYQSHSSSGATINTGANGLQRLDAVVASAEKHGVKLIINFVNFWDDYGGMNAYVKAYGGSKTGWYTNSKAQSVYQAYIKAVVNRYKTSNAIFAWELANEPRCQGCNTDIIYNWADTTSKYVKSLDPDHMVTLGDEGMGVPGSSAYPYKTSEGVDFVKNLKIKTLDFGTYHWYPGSCKCFPRDLYLPS